MYTIGQISKLVNVSKDTMRYYDTINLLKPATINKENNYRYYTETQVKEMLCIIDLKACGFNLDAIKTLLHAKDEAQLIEAYDSKLKALNVDLKEIEKTIAYLHGKLTNKGHGKRIILVDDSEFMRMMQKDILGKNNHMVVAEATNGLECLELLKTVSADMIILNIDMPELSGIDTLKKIDKNIPIIMCSKNATVINVLSSFLHKAQSFVAKPFNTDDFLLAIDSQPCHFEDKANHILKSVDYDFLLSQVQITELVDLLKNEDADKVIDKINYWKNA